MCLKNSDRRFFVLFLFLFFCFVLFVCLFVYLFFVLLYIYIYIYDIYQTFLKINKWPVPVDDIKNSLSSFCQRLMTNIENDEFKLCKLCLEQVTPVESVSYLWQK